MKDSMWSLPEPMKKRKQYFQIFSKDSDGGRKKRQGEKVGLGFFR